MCAFVSNFVTATPSHLRFRPCSICKRPSASVPITRSQPTLTATQRAATPSAQMAPSPAVSIYGVPVSNYTARCRYIVYRKSLQEEVAFLGPGDLGGLKSEQFTALNPFGKIPVAIVHQDAAATGSPAQAIYESDVICNYLVDRFNTTSPSFVAPTPELRARSANIVAILGLYIGPQHPYMYRVQDCPDRAAEVAKMNSGFDAIEGLLSSDGPFATGASLSVADACLWGNFPFYDFMLPTFFGWSPLDGRPKLTAWHKAMTAESKAARDMYNEVFTALQGWWDAGRWDKLSMSPLSGRPTSTV